MAATKVTSEVWSSQTLTAGAADTEGSAIDLTTAFGCTVGGKLTNGATGPTVAAQCKAQISPDGSQWTDWGGPYVGSVVNSAVVHFYWEFPPSVMYVRLVAGSNTDQNVTVDADAQILTALA